MLFKTPRWVLILEAVLLLGALTVLAYKAAMWVQPLGGLDKTPHAQKVDPETLARNYYHQYPESYIRISREDWVYIRRSGSARHSLTLKNSAPVSYSSIALQFDYESPTGKVLKSQVVEIPGVLPPSGTLDAKGILVNDVPFAAERVKTVVVRAKAGD